MASLVNSFVPSGCLRIASFQSSTHNRDSNFCLILRMTFLTNLQNSDNESVPEKSLSIWLKMRTRRSYVLIFVKSDFRRLPSFKMVVFSLRVINLSLVLELASRPCFRIPFTKCDRFSACSFCNDVTISNTSRCCAFLVKLWSNTKRLLVLPLEFSIMTCCVPFGFFSFSLESFASSSRSSLASLRNFLMVRRKPMKIPTAMLIPKNITKASQMIITYANPVLDISVSVVFWTTMTIKYLSDVP